MQATFPTSPPPISSLGQSRPLLLRQRDHLRTRPMFTCAHSKFLPPYCVGLSVAIGGRVRCAGRQRKWRGRRAAGQGARSRSRFAIGWSSGLQARLKTKSPSCDAGGACKCSSGNLPQRLVDETFFWARDARHRHATAAISADHFLPAGHELGPRSIRRGACSSSSLIRRGGQLARLERATRRPVVSGRQIG